MSEFWLVKSKHQLEDRVRYFQQYLEREWNWEHPVQWKVSKFSPKRSMSQNALFHVWCRELATSFAERGADIDEERMKTLLKYKFLGTETKVIGQTEIPDQVRETSSLTRGEMFEFMDEVQCWALDHGVNVTCPVDSEFMQIKGG